MAWTFQKMWILSNIIFQKASQGRRPGAMPPSPSPPTIFHTHTHTLFCVAKIKKGNKGKKGRVSKQKLLKGCHQGQNVTVLAILERLEFKNFSCRLTMVAGNTSVFHGPSTLKSVSPALKKILLVHFTTFFCFYFPFLLIFILNLSENSILKCWIGCLFSDLRRTARSETIFDNWKPFKNEKCFYFNLKALMALKIISSWRKNGSIRKIRLISKFLTS